MRNRVDKVLQSVTKYLQTHKHERFTEILKDARPETTEATEEPLVAETQTTEAPETTEEPLVAQTQTTEAAEASEGNTEETVTDSSTEGANKFTDLNFEDLGKEPERNSEDAATIDAAEAAAATEEDQDSASSEEENKS